MRVMRFLSCFLVLALGACAPQADRPTATQPAPQEPFAPTFLDRCWQPLPPDAWRLRSRSFGTWRRCMSGPREPAGPYAVAYFDVDLDGDVDLVDFAALQRRWTR